MTSRREQILDAAIVVLGRGGARALTHRAVDAAAELPAGSTSNHFRTREALLGAVIERVSERERAAFEEIAAGVVIDGPKDLARAFARAARQAAGPDRELTLARYAILVETAVQPALRAQVGAVGGRVSRWFTAWLRMAGSRDPDLHNHVIGNYVVGLILHQLAYPDPDFDPEPRLTALIETLLGRG